jgi:zinc protease
MADLSAASAEDVKDFFRTYYAPNNATIAIVGDFDPAQAKKWAHRYFDEIPRGKPIVRPTVPAVTLAAEKRLVYEDRVQIPRLYMVWPSVGEKHRDAAALELLGAVLTGTRTARLTKPLVYDRQVAASVGAGLNANENGGWFQVVVTPRPGNSLTQIEASVDSLLTRIKAEGPTLEELAETRAVTAADVRRVANQYLTRGRVILSIVPQGKPEQAAKAEASTKVSSTVPATPATQSRPTEGQQ